MRSEHEMYSLILRVAEGDERIRGVVMNGSRANPDAPKDVFQDYDIIYLVREIATFSSDWLNIFGERLMLQKPEEMRYPSGSGHQVYLMLFADGNRIDLTLLPMERLPGHRWESQSIMLLDKDHSLPAFPVPSDADYHIKPPSKLFYESCCNNFWWCSQNVAKGLRRGELPYAMYMLERVLRDELHDMLEWHIGVHNRFGVSAGHFGKYYRRFMSKRHYSLYAATFPGANPQQIWRALFAMCKLFRELAADVAAPFGYEYPIGDDERMTAYLRRVKALPRGAKRIF